MGIVVISFAVVFFNFFFKISWIIQSFILFTLLAVNFNLRILKKLVSISLILSFIIFIITLNKSYHNDFGLYHLPYIEYLNSDKINFGLTNINFRFGHASVLSYFTSLFNFKILNIGIVSMITSHVFIVAYFIYTAVKNLFIKKGINFFDIFSIFIICYFLMHINGLNKIGYDVFPIIFIFQGIKLFKTNNLKFSIRIKGIIFFLYAFFLKTITLGFFIIPLIYFIKNPNKLIIVLKSQITFISIAITLLFILKNIINTGCILYPADFTCFDNLIWTSKTYGDAYQVYLETSAWAKGWPDQLIKINYSEYTSNLNWIKTYFTNHFINIVFFKAILLYLIILIILIIINIKSKYHYKNNVIDNDILFGGLSSSILWFLSAPLLRYGYAPILLLLSAISSYYSYYYFENLRIKKILKIFLIILIVQFIFRWAIFQIEGNKNTKFPNIEKITSQIINNINYVETGMCWDIKFPCVTKSDQINNIIVKKIFGYTLYLSRK
jgi:hypothetical protein